MSDLADVWPYYDRHPRPEALEQDPHAEGMRAAAAGDGPESYRYDHGSEEWVWWCIGYQEQQELAFRAELAARKRKNREGLDSPLTAGYRLDGGGRGGTVSRVGDVRGGRVCRNTSCEHAGIPQHPLCFAGGDTLDTVCRDCRRKERAT